jgi:transcriptional regulator with PAS, ATPase and Fis domain
MINAIDKPTIFITPDYIIQAVNQAYKETYKTEVTVGQSKCHEISHKNPKPCDNYGEDCPLQQCISSKRTVSVVHIHATGEGKSYCDILMKPIIDEDGITLGFLEILDKINYASSESEKGKMIGSSSAFKSMINKINRAAKSKISVLLQGETGTGKELVAQAIHDASPRNEKPFVVIECTGLSESLFESELFGYEKGAFTGATNSKKGLIEVANSGTVFFDEIGDVPLNMQVKLLRLLETQSFRAVGGLKQKRSDFRLVCATHKNLLDLVEKGQFRQDLYYRIAGFPIILPSLKERAKDIPELVSHFLKHSEHQNKRFSENALSKLCGYTFPGNIRELISIIEQSALLANDDTIHTNDLPDVVRQSATIELPHDNIRSLDEIERAYLTKLCNEFTGTPDELASLLNVSTRTLYRKLQRFDLKLF